jgi:O-antigen/teichoic acid export membrane protein
LENLKYLNLANLISKIITILFVLVFIKNQVDAPWVNFIMGCSLSICYLFVLIWGINKYKISWVLPSKLSQKVLLKSNFYLLVNNFSVHLQQSFMLFALQIWGKAAWLGAYALCDKIVWSSRLLIISISNSVYPTAAQLHKTDTVKWLAFKQQLKWRTGYLFLSGSAVLFLLSDPIIFLLSGNLNAEASLFLKLMAFAPFIASLNFMNVLDRVLNNDNYSIFQIAIILLMVSSLSAFGMVYWGNFWGVGLYTLTVETIALLLYEFKARKLNIVTNN